MKKPKTTPKTTVAVEELRGGEQTSFGEVAYTICELDGVDVVFLPDEPHHFDYGYQLEVSGA